MILALSLSIYVDAKSEAVMSKSERWFSKPIFSAVVMGEDSPARNLAHRRRCRHYQNALERNRPRFKNKG